MRVKLLLGPICSGKTTYAKKLRDAEGYTRLSQDDLKKMMWGKLENNEEKDQMIGRIIYNMVLNLTQGGCNISDAKIVIDGYPLNTPWIGFILNTFKAQILLFDIDVYTANIRNRKRRKETGLIIEPNEIRRYDDVYHKFIKSDSFKELMNSTKASVINMKELEKLCSVMPII